jgi:hypothetical protein
MKRLAFVVIAILAATLIASCDFGAPDLGTTEGVRIAIESGSGVRSLIPSVAQSDMDYVEVIFRKASTTTLDPSGYETYRQGWKVNNIGTVGIPKDFDLDDPDCQALLLGGLNDGKVLLAVGRVSKIDSVDVGPGNTEIVGGNTVTFKMAALTTLITNDPGNTDFAITGGPGVEPTSAISGDIPTLKNRGVEIPVFAVPKQTTGVTASYQFGFTFLNDPNPDFADYAPFIINAGTPTSVIRQMGTTLDSGYRRAAVTTLVTTGFAKDDPLPQTLNISFNTLEDGLCTIFLRIPVYMFGVDHSLYYETDKVNHTKWYIQSGLDNSLLDDGSAKWDQDTNGTGGSILLGIGAYGYRDEPGSEIEIEW